MTEYTSAVERQKILIEAEKWAKEIRQTLSLTNINVL